MKMRSHPFLVNANRALSGAGAARTSWESVGLRVLFVALICILRRRRASRYE